MGKGIYTFRLGDKAEAMRLVGWLEFKQIPYETGVTVVSSIPILRAELTLVERLMLWINFRSLYEYSVGVPYYEIASRSF